MKNLLLLLILITSIASAQIVNIPDASFKAELIADGVDTNTDGEIQVNEALAITSMSLNTLTIVDLEGIQSFINLETLNCNTLSVNSLDLSNNVNLKSVNSISNPLLSESLATIDVSACPLLETLVITNSSLTTLDCSNNTNLTLLQFVGNTFLETVFIKNGADESTNLDSGSWSENWAFGNNPSLIYVCADEDQVVEIQQFAETDYPVNSYCTFTPGGDVNTITGITQFDNEEDGCDNDDIILPYTSFNVNLDGTPTNVIAYSNNAGVYNVYAGQAGTYTLLPNLENPTYFNVTPSPADVVIPIIDNSTVTQDFCVTANGIHPDLEVAVAPIVPARPGFDATYSLTVKNKGNQTLSGDVTFNYNEDLLDFISASETPDTQAAGTMNFLFSDLQPYQNHTIEIIFSVNSPTDTPPVNIDDILVFDALVNPVSGDETPLDNSFTYNQVVVGSFDPNDIVCIQGDNVPSTFIGEYLHYVINFENTGTAAAENVVVTMDINSDDFDPSSLQILSASHPMDVTISNGVVEFVFQMINLDTGGHGNILLKMRTNTNLEVTDDVGAKANIYFDFNFPIETNEALTTFSLLGTNTFDNTKMVVYPNPANNVVKLQSNTIINSISVYDIQGRTINTVAISEENTEVNISSLNPGIYFFSVETNEGTIVKKIIKR